MKIWSHTYVRRGAVSLATLLTLTLAYSPAQARGKTKINYIPGVTVVPDVFNQDGQTLRKYNEGSQGLTYWHEGLPIQQGDKIRINAFVATGGADLTEIRVTLDNKQIADTKTSPWNTVIDTSQLSVGTHMVEVWAQATGDPPQSAEKSLSFLVDKDLPAQFLVKGVQDIQSGGQQTEITPTPDANYTPALPSPISGTATDENATVSIATRPAAQPSSLPIALGAGPVSIQEPTVFIVRVPQGSSTKQYVYALARDGQTILSSTVPYSISNPDRLTVIKIQKRTDTEDGLRPGAVTMFVWGVDAEGRHGDAVRVPLEIPQS